MWWPPPVNKEILDRCNLFEREGVKFFSKKRKIIPNLSPFLRCVLSDLQQDDQTVYTTVDKGLGFCAVELKRYQKWCLKHLTNKKTYKLLSKEEVWAEAYKLRNAIYKWTIEHKPVAGKDAVNYIRAQLVKGLPDPFACFYVMPKIHKAGPKGSHTPDL